MNKLTFEDYLEDILDLHIGIMSDVEINSAKTGYIAFCAPTPKAATLVSHPDSKMKLAELRNKVERFISSATITVERNQEKDLTLVLSFAAKAKSVLDGRHTKAALLDLITLNSEANRHMNSQRG